MSAFKVAALRVRWRPIVIALVAPCLISVVFQLILPSKTTSSRAKLGEIDLVAMRPEHIENTLRAVEESSYLFVKVGDEQYIKRFADIGITIDYDNARQLAEYPFYQRLIPFSGLIRYLNSERPIEYNYDVSLARNFIEEIAPFAEQTPEPAYLTAQDGRVVVTTDELGYRLDIDKAVEALGQVDYIDRIEVELERQSYQDELTTASALVLAEQANHVIDSAPVFVDEDNQVINLPAEELADWFVINQPADDNSAPSLGLDETKIDEYLDRLANQLALPSSRTQLTLQDDQEISRIEGAAGKVIDRDKALADLKLALEEPTLVNRISLRYIDVPAGVSYNRTYTKTANGLNVYLKDLIQARGNYSVSVYHLTKPIKASYRGNDVMTAASTYKLYVAYYVVNRIEANELSWQDTLPSGRTIIDCYNQMIEISSNSCAVELRERVGVNNINNALRAIGIPSAGFTANNVVTSPDELNIFLEKLYRGQLMQASHQQALLDLMFRQIHRKAIPTGVAPTPVADKGGFVYGFNHDTGIVYADSGAYALTIMSRGHSKAQMASLAREIHDFVVSL